MEYTTAGQAPQQMIAEESIVTIGMRLDAFLASLDGMSSTRLYGLIVAVTVVISFALLGVSKDDISSLPPTASVPSTTTATTKDEKPQPKWFVFELLNYVFVGLFLGSIAMFGMNASNYLQNSSSLLQFLVGWSLFLLYFFGFFGISFINPSEFVHEQQQQEEQQQHHQQQKVYVLFYLFSHLSRSYADLMPTLTFHVLFYYHRCEPQQEAVSSNTSSISKSIHPPAASTPPLCSDPPKMTTTKTSTTTTTKAIVKVSPSVDVASLPDAEVAQLVLQGKMKDHELEKRLGAHRAVPVRRMIMDQRLASLGKQGVLDNLPSTPSLDYSRVQGANCEIVVGYVPLPVGMVGPMTINNETIYFPMATTEGCLVASTQRGAKAITQGGGASACIVRDGITRAPCVRMRSAMEAASLKIWCETPENFAKLKEAFETTTSFGKLRSCQPTVAGRNVYLRLVCFSGDAMGMNMVSKGSLAVIDLLQKQFPSLRLVALSGNMCTDKKAAATNWLEGRGKSVVVEAVIPANVVANTLKTTVDAIVETNLHKNLIGSAMAGALGGFNAHASNIVTAVFLATGQDPAQNVESSNCITLLEKTEEGDLWVSCTMPSIEVGTVGGGTSLPAQAACLAAIGVKGGGASPGENARKLAQVVAAATMAGELSLIAALAANTLVQAHMKHNRKK